MSRWFALINPSAGRHRPPLDDLREAAQRHGVETTFATSTSVSDAGRVVAEAMENGFTQFISVGGDGTANVLVNALMPQHHAERLTVGIISSGSGCDLVRTFGHTRNIDDGFRRLLVPDRYPIDIGVITLGDRRTYFLNAANIGVAARAAAVAERLPRRVGSVRYNIGFWLALAGQRLSTITVNVDRHRFHGQAINVVVANGQFFGGGMNIAPRASLTDGLFDVQVFRGPKRQAFTVMPRILRGTHLTHHGVQRYVGSNIVVSSEDDLLVEADGELIGKGSPTIAVVPHAIDLAI